ncbi:MAG: hypothetical protein BMS9Abin31_0135 [Gammaproteobacteria bacterium]|nr:MAG: hypothetical protein BMS9Abin31_0135 [Gammaproteobacteria bacterium]
MKKDTAPKKLRADKVYIPITFYKICNDGSCFVDTAENALEFLLDGLSFIDKGVSRYNITRVIMSWSQFEELPEFEGF